MGLLRKSPRERLSAAEALGHAWFTQPALPVAPVAPASPRTGQVTPRARHLPSLIMLQPLITRRPLETHRAAALTRRLDATPAVELDLGAKLPHKAGVRRRVTSPDRDCRPTLLSPKAAPRATGASAVSALTFTSAAAAQGPTSSTSATAAAAVSPRPDRGSRAPSVATAHAGTGPQSRGPGAAVASPSAVRAALHLLDGDTDAPPQRDTSPAPAVERLTNHHVRWHDVSSASRCDLGDVARQDSCASPVHAWSRQTVPDRPSFLERLSFGDRSDRPSFGGEVSSSLCPKKVRRLPKPEDRPSGLFAVPPHAGARAPEKPSALLADPEQVAVPADLAVVRLPSAPPPQRCRRPAGLHHHRHRNLRQS